MYIYRSACKLWYIFERFYIDRNFVAIFTINSDKQNIIKSIYLLSVYSIRSDTIHECNNWIVSYGRCGVCVCVCVVSGY